MTLHLADACIYTIATTERLRAAARGRSSLKERKPWVTGARLLTEAQSNERSLAIVFADSRDCSRLVAWSILTSVSISDDGTEYQFGSLWTLPNRRPQDLRGLKSGKYIAEGHIRPYVLCRTPSFLHKQALQPRPWKVSAAERRRAVEGRRRLVVHERLERNRSLVAEAKQQYSKRHNGRLPCQVCGFDFLSTYGDTGHGFIEAHHRESLAESPRRGRMTELKDLAMVCANCHRMLHAGPDFPSVNALRRLIKRNDSTRR